MDGAVGFETCSSLPPSFHLPFLLVFTTTFAAGLALVFVVVGVGQRMVYFTYDVWAGLVTEEPHRGLVRAVEAGESAPALTRAWLRYRSERRRGGGAVPEPELRSLAELSFERGTYCAARFFLRLAGDGVWERGGKPYSLYHYAAASRCSPGAKLLHLLSMAGAEPNIVAHDGATPLHMAVQRKGCVAQAVAALLYFGANPYLPRAVDSLAPADLLPPLDRISGWFRVYARMRGAAPRAAIPENCIITSKG